MKEDNKPDIFISYAKEDNEPFVGVEKGWVTTLVEELKKGLNKTGNNYSLWMDTELRGNDPITQTIIDQIKNSAILLVILSPAYVKSAWCMTELNVFLNSDKTSDKISSRCVFVVEYSEVERPERLKDLPGYRFWYRDDKNKSRTLAIPQPDPNNHNYYDKIHDLADDLAKKITSLRNQSEKKIDNAPTVNRQKTVFLAEVSDLKNERNQIKTFLVQQYVRVFPEKPYSIVANISQSIEYDFSQSRLFVQLLGDKTCSGLPNFQLDWAKNKKLEILEWCNTSNIRLEDFQNSIINRLEPKPEIYQPKDFVFINAAEKEDMSLALEIQNFFETRKIVSRVPLTNENLTALQLQQDLEQQLLDCKAVIIVYNTNTPPVWVMGQINHYQRMRPARSQPDNVAVYKSGQDNPSLSDIPNYVRVLQCSNQPVDETCLSQFIQNF